MALTLGMPLLTGEKRYRDNGWCLSHKAGDVEVTSRSSASIPVFQIPAPFVSRNLVSGAEISGLRVRYIKSSSVARELRISGTSTLFSGCAKAPTDHDLVALTDTGQENCPLLTQVRRLVPVVLDETYGSVRINCGLDDAVRKCQMSNVMHNDWEAQISIPKESLGDWRLAALAASQFFDDHLTDCGSK